MMDIRMGDLLWQAIEDRLRMVEEGIYSAQDPATVGHVANLGYAYVMQRCIDDVGGDADGSKKVTAGEFLDVESVPKNCKADRHDKG